MGINGYPVGIRQKFGASGPFFTGRDFSDGVLFYGSGFA